MPSHFPVVVAQLVQHLLRRHVAGIVVEDSLQSSDVADGPKGCTLFFEHVPQRDR